MLSRYIKWTLKGILKFNITAIILFSTQISLLVIPLLPSTPSAFFPLLIVSSIIKFKEEEQIYEKSII